MIINELTLTFFQKSPDLIGLLAVVIGLLFFVGMIYQAYRVYIGLRKRKEKIRFLKSEILPELFSKFGKVLSIEVVQVNRLIRFERYGTLFEVEVTPILSRGIRLVGLKSRICFSLPNLRKKFYIQKKHYHFTKNLSDCQELHSLIPKDFIFHSRNPQFLFNLLAKDKILSELNKYEKKISGQFGIAFEDGLFTFVCHRWNEDEGFWDSNFDGESAEMEAEKLEQICQTAVVFYDELAKKS